MAWMAHMIARVLVAESWDAYLVIVVVFRKDILFIFHHIINVTSLLWDEDIDRECISSPSD